MLDAPASLPEPPPRSAVLRVERVVSGGQTGVDRAALDVAIALGIPHGGWCPRGRRALDGPLPARYQLQETESAGYRQRTRRNVESSDGTLVLNDGELAGGTALTAAFAQRLGKPCIVIPLDDDPDAAIERATAWCAQHRIRTLNVAGPSERKRPGIYDRARVLLEQLLR